MSYRQRMTGTATTWQGDAIVVGAGPAGCATATVLARHGRSVCVIDDGRRTSWPGETLPAGSGRVIDDVFGSHVLARHDRAYAVRAAWETPELHVTDALLHPLGEGWLLDRRVFDTQARDAAVTAGAVVLDGHAAIERDGVSGWVAHVGGQTVRASLLIDATGRTASIARRNGARGEQASRLLACIVVVPDRGDGVQATTVESVSEGWWYSTPTPSGGRVLALVSDAELVPRGDDRNRWWLDSLRATGHIRSLLPAGAVDDAIVRTMTLSQAGTGWLAERHGPGWVAVGDAAAHFDPLSSQGLLTGILMGARAGQSIVEDSLETWSVDYRILIDEHQALARHYYRLVDRWPDSPFWSHRARTG